VTPVTSTVYEPVILARAATSPELEYCDSVSARTPLEIAIDVTSLSLPRDEKSPEIAVPISLTAIDRVGVPGRLTASTVEISVTETPVTSTV
jgi:hypothetical protein